LGGILAGGCRFFSCFLLYSCLNSCTIAQETKQMEDQILLKLDDGLEMVVTFEVEAGEEATQISPSHPVTVHIIRVVLWQKNHTSFERIDITCADDNLLDYNHERIEQEIWEHVQNQ